MRSILRLLAILALAPAAQAAANGESFFKELLEISIADVYTPWEWQDYVPYEGRR